MISVAQQDVSNLFFTSRYTNCVGNDKRCHLLLDSLYFLERDHNVCDPTEQIRVEADVVLRNVEASVHENVFRQCTPVICC